MGCVSDDFGYLGENLSESKLNVIRMFDFGTGCKSKPYIQCAYIVRPVLAGLVPLADLHCIYNSNVPFIDQKYVI